MVLLLVVELLIPYLMSRFLGVPWYIGVVSGFAIIVAIVYILWRREISTNSSSDD
jgi:hypothetical protein